MKDLLIAEMKRAIVLLESSDKPFTYNYEDVGRAAELKRLMLSVRKHSVALEKEELPYWRR
jgi:hypothetical protein